VSTLGRSPAPSDRSSPCGTADGRPGSTGSFAWVADSGIRDAIAASPKAIELSMFNHTIRHLCESYLLFYRRAVTAMPKLRDWMNTSAWLVNIIVCAIFIVLIL
jgi:hypothetical protein